MHSFSLVPSANEYVSLLLFNRPFIPLNLSSQSMMVMSDANNTSRYVHAHIVCFLTKFHKYANAMLLILPIVWSSHILHGNSKLYNGSQLKSRVKLLT